MNRLRACAALLLLSSLATPLAAQGLEGQLKALGSAQLAKEARQFGDPARGAVVFYQAYMACVRCHTPDENAQQLGPALTQPEAGSSDADVVESILEPSKKIRKGFEPVQIVTTDGEILQGLVSRETEDRVYLRDAGKDFKEVELAKEFIEERTAATVSMMPAGLANALTSRQQFLDLVRYVLEIRDGGVARMRQLEPPPASYAARPLPEYESHIDHAGLIRAWNDDAYQRGEAIYNRLCVNCHGTISQPGSLPTSLRFAEGRFKNGSDPLTMYQTLTRGFGMMVAQTWMVPSQKYDVIHYIREAYLREHNPTQYVALSDTYVASLPAGDTFGPEPSNVLEWEQMDYGPNLVMTLEFGKDGSNIAQKANAIRLDAGPGGVSQGKYWMAYDYDTMRMAGAWSGDQFCDWHGINFDGGHGTHPRVVGTVHASNPTGPGWGRPEDGSFVDESRVLGRDGRQYGPLPRQWAQYRGMYYHGPNTLIEYTVGKTRVLEMPSVLPYDESPVFLRTLNIGPRDQQLVLQVAHRPDAHLAVNDGSGQEYVTFGRSAADAGESAVPSSLAAREFNGTHYWQVTEVAGLPINQADFTLAARIKTDKDGTIVSQTTTDAAWKPMGFTWFLRDGRLTVDIGWVGAVQGRRRVTDNQWHEVAMTYRASTGEVAFFVDGQLDTVAGQLRRNTPLEDAVLRIGYTAANFPDRTAFEGQLSDVKYYRGIVLSAKQTTPSADAELLAHWPLKGKADTPQVNTVSERYPLVMQQVGKAAASDAENLTLVAGYLGTSEALPWNAVDGALRLTIPPGRDPLRLTLWFANAPSERDAQEVAARVVVDQPAPDLAELTRGGPARWPQELVTTATLGDSHQPFAIDDLARPADNPWFCRLRLTGLDFLPGGDQMVVSAWDGNVWLISGLKGLEDAAAKGDATCQISWRRIASGLFQPLGIKFHQGRLYVTCRDQLCVLHDLNGDGEIDWYQCFNNDHQVTEHFHEFAMGLQVDDAGSFYYAKSARHALKAVVPHHGTLLRISPDGAQTEIVATGFRAANGICLNPDGSFIVTDQEGHWNPKNRINYVRRGGFYGNMFGYHDVTDDSDDAMEQPLCWITNDFDRSPGELLWVTSDAWGPLKGQLLNLSYGYGMIYVVPHEIVHGQPQGGMAEFPITRLPTGVMRGRFSPDDGQLYTCGMFAWAGNQTQPGGLYRVRYTGAPVHLPIALHAQERRIEMTLSGELDRTVASDPENYQIKVWSLKRTANYGSQHYDEHPLAVTSVTVSADGRTVQLTVPDLAPTWGMEIRYRLKSSSGQSIDGRIHNTIHELPPPGGP